MKTIAMLLFILFTGIAGYSQPVVIHKNAPDSLTTTVPGENIDYTSGSYALVAGGSKGIGFGIAEALARRHYNLVLIARHSDSLIAAKHRLETTYNIHVEILPYDLSKETTAEEIARCAPTGTYT